MRLTERHGRMFAEVADSGIAVSARSVDSLRSKLMTALELSLPQWPTQIYWSLDGEELSAVAGSDALAGWQIRRQAEVDRKLSSLRSPGADLA